MNSAQRPPKSAVCRYALLLLLLVLLPVCQALAQGTTTTVTSSQSTITLGDTVTFTATVTTDSGTPTGLVTFFDGVTPLGNGILTIAAGQNQASFSTSLLSAAASPHSITATYQGADTHGGSTSTASSVTVNARTSTTSPLVMSLSTVVVGQPSTATVTVTDSGSVPPGTADTFSTTRAPITSRAGATATLIADGQVFVAGGLSGFDGTTVLNTAEIYNVFPSGTSSGSFSPISANMESRRLGHVAVLLPNGKVLLAGGTPNISTNDNPLKTVELFDPVSQTFSTAFPNDQMSSARYKPVAALLNNGKVLVAGGLGAFSTPLASAELYDPVFNSFTATGSMNTARVGATATLLGNGKVLIVGGSSDGLPDGALNTAELFDPAGNGGAGTFTAITGPNSTLSALRWEPEAALLPNGKVLIAGGQNSGGVLASADLYDPVANTFTASNHSMSQARANGSAVALANGMVLLAGGTPSQAVDLYDADSDNFVTTGSLQQSDAGPPFVGPEFAPALVSTLLNNGDVLVVGVTTNSVPNPASDAEIYAPSFNPLGTVGVTSSEATDSITGACVLTPSTTAASTCTATVTPANIATSPHTITGTYPADAVHSGSSNTASLTVNQAAAATTVVSSSNPSVLAQSVTFTATVAAVAPGGGTPTGTVAFLDGATQIGTGTLLGGIATFATSGLALGNHTITTTYGGDLNFTGSTGSLTGNPQVVNKANTATSLTSNQNPAAVGQSVTFTATVSPVAPGSGTPTGTVNFLDGASPIGSGMLSGGVVTFLTSSLTAGNHTITASYGGDGNFNGSTGSLAGNPQVIIAPPAATKAFNPSGIPPSGISTLTITITNPAANTVALTNVSFTDTFPANLLIATPSGLSNTCGGTPTAAAGGSSVSLTGGTVAVNSSCTVSVNMTSQFTGSYVNSFGPVTSDNGGAGNSASATLSIKPANLSITKTHDVADFPRSGQGTWFITVSNDPTAGPTLGTVTVVDTLPVIGNPNNVVPASMTGTGWTCTLSTLTCTRSEALAPGASYPSISLTVNVPQNITANVTNSATVSGGGDPNSHTASDPTHIGPPN